MGTIVEIDRRHGGVNPDTEFRDGEIEPATKLDYLLFFGFSAISCSLMGLGLAKLADLF